MHEVIGFMGFHVMSVHTMTVENVNITFYSCVSDIFCVMLNA